MVDIFDSVHSYRHLALDKITRRKNSPQKNESETVLSPIDLQNLDYNSISENQFRSTIVKLTSGSGKKHKGIKRLHDGRI